MTYYSLMTKKLDSIHILQTEGSGRGTRTLCGRPFLGNDYMKVYKKIDNETGRPRHACEECLRNAVIHLNNFSDSIQASQPRL